jgi:DNA polymerase zeta
MTTFEAVSAHWPKLNRTAKSTQKSKLSKKGKSSAAAASSPLPHISHVSSPVAPHLVSSPVKPSIKPEPSPPTPPPENAEDVEMFSSDDDVDADDDDNPFHVFAMTQAPRIDMKIEVDAKYIAGDTGLGQDDDDEEEGQRRHAEAVQQRAEVGRDYRATQAPPVGKEESEYEYDDAELEALFKKTVTGGLSAPSTPRRRAEGGVSVTPTTTGSSGSGSVDARRWQRDRRMREQAGWGDLRYFCRAKQVGPG